MVVIRCTKGGSYVIAEMDGTVLREKVGAFRVIPHFERYEPVELPANIHNLIDLNVDQLNAMVEDNDRAFNVQGKDLAFTGAEKLNIIDYVAGGDSDSEWEDE